MGKRRHRRDPEPGKFEDPLSNYDERVYADALERSLAEDTVTVINTTPYHTVSPDLTVREAMEQMSEHVIACLVVVDEQHKPVGILSERDILMRFALEYDQVADQSLGEMMTKDPVVVHESENPARVINQMFSGKFRHVPVVDADGKLVGIIGPRRVTSYLQKYFEDVSNR
ncbi:MAG: CBS domain-containing protein [Planctomycetota bacterium]|jgi:CBS domain-containing protein